MMTYYRHTLMESEWTQWCQLTAKGNFNCSCQDAGTEQRGDYA